MIFKDMYLNSQDKTECCGCSSCEQICPINCIRMVEDEEGFLYPEVNRDSCIGCGLCEKACPIANYDRIPQADFCYYGWHKNKDIRALSTSGAAFIAISQVCKEVGYTHFYGAAYDEKMQIRHTDVLNFDQPELLRCSKYAQSQMGRTFSEIKEYLKKGEKVLFSGTPCQVDGLKRYLGKLGEHNLFLVALVCHGVSSPKAFSIYLHEMANIQGSPIKRVRFRDKRVEKGVLSHCYTTVGFQNGQEISSTEDLYTLAFGIGVMDRESCYTCPYTSPSGAGDITIGDFWGLEKRIPQIQEEISKGISLLIPHTDKGDGMIRELSRLMILERVPLKYAVNEQQQQLSRPIIRPVLRDSFLKEVLLKNKSFCKEAQTAIWLWKIEHYKRRALEKVKKLIGKGKE